MASIARSNRTLSGCLESTLAMGLVTFLFVQATVIRSTLNNRNVTRLRDISTSKAVSSSENSCQFRASSSIGRFNQKLDLLQRGFRRCLQQFSGIGGWIAIAEHRVACNENFC